MLGSYWRDDYSDRSNRPITVSYIRLLIAIVRYVLQYILCGTVQFCSKLVEIYIKQFSARLQMFVIFVCWDSRLCV